MAAKILSTPQEAAANRKRLQKQKAKARQQKELQDFRKGAHSFHEQLANVKL